MPKKCPKCGASFPTAAKLSRHLERLVPCDKPKETKNFKCKLCSAEFSFQSGLSRHKLKCENDADSKAPAKQNIDVKESRAAVHINPFTENNEIIVTVDMIKYAFTKNDDLRALCQMSSECRTRIAHYTYVEIALIGFVELAHANPAQRNIYINMARNDQVKVYEGGQWVLRQLAGAVHRMLHCICAQLMAIAGDNPHAKILPVEVADSLSWIGLKFQEQPQKIVDDIAKKLSAHLTNLVPGFLKDTGEHWNAPEKVKMVGPGLNYQRMAEKLGPPRARKNAPQGLPVAARSAAGPNVGVLVANHLMKIKDAKSVDVEVCRSFMDAVAKDAKQPLDHDLANEIVRRILESNDERAKAIMHFLDAGKFEPVAEDAGLPPTRAGRFLNLLREHLPRVNPETITVEGCRDFVTAIARGLGAPFSKEFMWELGPYVWRIHPEWKDSRFYKILYPGGPLDRQLLAESDDAADAAEAAEAAAELAAYRKGLGRRDTKMVGALAPADVKTAAAPVNAKTPAEVKTPQLPKKLVAGVAAGLGKPPQTHEDALRFIEAVRSGDPATADISNAEFLSRLMATLAALPAK